MRGARWVEAESGVSFFLSYFDSFFFFFFLFSSSTAVGTWGGGGGSHELRFRTVMA